MGGECLQSEQADVLVIGGGINGAGIARDATGRGLRVVLCEQGDLAQYTSSASTKLIHGGLRYLERYEFALVRQALQEREVLLRSAPHIIWPLRFLLPHHRALRPRWVIGLGLLLYDHLYSRQLMPGSRAVDLRTHVGGAALKETFTHAFEYSDCWVQDARLVVLCARDAARRGAKIMMRTRCVGLSREHDRWLATLQHAGSNAVRHIDARAVVNASGPWVEQTLHLGERTDSECRIRLVKGSHIVVPKLFEHDHPYIFQNRDGRVVFAIPFEGEYTLLGTTDVEIQGDPAQVTIDKTEVLYLCDAISEYFRERVTPEDVVWSYAGVRPLFDDAAKSASAVTRDYVLQLDCDGAPILSVFGGKLTTFRKLAEKVVDMLKAPLHFDSGAWTAGKPLPGGDMPNADYGDFLRVSAQNYPWLSASLLADYTRNYGTEIATLLRGCGSMADLGEDFGGGLFEREVEYLVTHEWAQTTDDVLWRRTKKGLRVPPGTEARLRAWLGRHRDAVIG